MAPLVIHCQMKGLRTLELNVTSEYAKLEAVLVHRPGDEIDRLTHDNMKRFLFEDIPFLRRMQDEHDAFVAKMQARDITVYYLEKLLADLLTKQPDAKKKLIEDVCYAERMPALVPDLLNEKYFSNEKLLSILFAGMTEEEYTEATGRRSEVEASVQANLILTPIPNAYFSRDPAVVVGHAAVSCKMHYAERVRETILVRAVLENHPEFAKQEIIYGRSSMPTEDRPFTIEGGDVLVLNEEAILVGVSERTRSETVEVLARKAFVHGNLKRVYEIPIPSERTFMHLDTVLTIIDRGVVVWYPGVVENIKHIHKYELSSQGAFERKTDPRDLKRAFSDEFGCELKIIRTGGGDKHFASREQRTEGTNAFAIAPRVVCSYERNVRTIAAMEKEGIECIHVVGSELVRGLGGPRCMTMPLFRKPA